MELCNGILLYILDMLLPTYICKWLVLTYPKLATSCRNHSGKMETVLLMASSYNRCERGNKQAILVTHEGGLPLVPLGSSKHQWSFPWLSHSSTLHVHNPFHTEYLHQIISMLKWIITHSPMMLPTPDMHNIYHVFSISHSVQFAVLAAFDKLWRSCLNRVQVWLGIRTGLKGRPEPW